MPGFPDLYTSKLACSRTTYSLGVFCFSSAVRGTVAGMGTSDASVLAEVRGGAVAGRIIGEEVMSVSTEREDPC